MFKLIKFVLGVAVVGGLAAAGYFAVINRQINVNHFFIGGMSRGADVSSYQGEIDMQRLKEQNIDFIYIKATEGSSYKDPNFTTNWQNAAEAGLTAGAYHFFSYESSGATQAENFINTVGALSGRLVPVVDLELSTEQKKSPPDKAEVVKSLKTLVAALEEKYDTRPMLYATRDYFEKYLKDDFSGYPRWVRSVFWPVYLEAGNDWVLWQYDDHAKLEGYRGSEEFIDLNVVNPEKGLEAIKYN
ncbi:glycoside hydrolase family 25 [Candidatus Saccharibacteria bacterium]|nr:glycoside hydrolase family 25 [Candidatus Saccharibacteria bacterium]